MVDALTVRGDEGRTRLRKAMGSCQEALIHRYPNGTTRHIMYVIYIYIEANLVKWNISVARGREINRDSVSSGERKRIRAARFIIFVRRITWNGKP